MEAAEPRPPACSGVMVTAVRLPINLTRGPGDDRMRGSRRVQVNRDEVLAAVQAEGVRQVRFLYCDNANIVRGKAAHAGALADFLESGIGLTVAMQGFCLTEHLAPGSALGPVGEVRLVP